MAERLQKFLAKSGIGSRRFCETLIKSKRIKINGVIAEIGVSVTKNDFIEFDGEQGAKAQGKWRSEGADYEVKDGDIILFRFNV